MFNIVVIEITDRCNLHCKYCYENPRKSCNTDMEVKRFKKFIENPQVDFNECVLSGGEPLLHPQWREFVNILRQNNMKVNFISNGSQIKEIIQCSIKIDSITISIDSFDECYCKMRSPKPVCKKEDIIALIRSGLVEQLNLQVILSRVNANKDNMSDIIDFCRQYKVGLKIKIMDDYIHNGTSDDALKESEYTVFLQEVAKLISEEDSFFIELPEYGTNQFCSCAILQEKSNLRICSDGRMFACEKANDNDMLIGSMEKDREQISKRYNEVRLLLIARMIKLSKTFCSMCVYNNECNKGCPVVLKLLKENPKCQKGRMQNGV
ncbi:MAG: radical SAM protein [Lachnospiraceae bacterium]|nr:radical SAM protein [Lachnospiraceae bacterium]